MARCPLKERTGSVTRVVRFVEESRADPGRRPTAALRLFEIGMDESGGAHMRSLA